MWHPARIDRLADTPLAQLLDRVASAQPVPGAGPAAAWTCALAEQELIEHASHGDQHATTRIARDAERADEEAEPGDAVYGEADQEHKPD